jgi:dTDP-4-amino-4,6-dideoxygalactose transaminase
MMNLKPFNGLAYNDVTRAYEFLLNSAMGNYPLSGYLAGRERGGSTVMLLEEQWATKFHVKHAIAVNSATSGLMAAAFAIGLKSGDRFVCPAMTMSATAAAPMFTGATPFFADVEDITYGISDKFPHDAPIFAANLFGHPAHLHNLRQWCDANHTVLIEDNSQSPFSWDVGHSLAGTIGHIGVFSLNVHKPIQCGEGGIVVTDDDVLAKRIRDFINHGENTGFQIGLNLRMPEICASIALSQLGRGEEIAQGRINQALTILDEIGNIPGLGVPLTRSGCRHTYYTIPFLLADRRQAFCEALRAEGVPIVEGYVAPLYRLPAFSRYARPCPVAEGLHDRHLFYFENCQYDVTVEQAEQIGAAFRKAAEEVL